MGEEVTTVTVSQANHQEVQYAGAGGLERNAEEGRITRTSGVFDLRISGEHIYQS